MLCIPQSTILLTPLIFKISLKLNYAPGKQNPDRGKLQILHIHTSGRIHVANNGHVSEVQWVVEMDLVVVIVIVVVTCTHYKKTFIVLITVYQNCLRITMIL